MAQGQGSLQNLAEGSQESLRALIQAIIPDASSTSDGKLSGDAVARLTEKLTELMGPETAEAVNQNRNDRGELLNEEGLPIIEITEPADYSSRSIPPPITVEPLLPLASLSLPVRERLREKRNRILDLLEDEERKSGLLEKERELKDRDESLRTRKEEAAKEKDKLSEARQLQKKMGRALLQNMGKVREKEEKEKEAQRLQDEEIDRRRSPSTKKKSVAFVETPDGHGKTLEDESHPSGIQWGDVTPARLQNTKRPTLTSQSLIDKHPMKMSVIERVPGGQPTLPRSHHPSQNIPDSDDESDPENTSELSGSATDEDEPVLEEDPVDFDVAQLQREITMEYYQKRNTIRQEAAFVMTSRTHDADDQSQTRTDGSREGQKPAISHFRASNIAAAYGALAPGVVDPDSVSLGASVLPASSTRTLQRAIKTGRLDSDGRLVGAEENSASEEEDEGMQEVLELLKKGEIYNLGPNGEYLHSAHPSPGPSTSQPERTQHSTGLPPPSKRSGTSKFKASLASSGRPAASASHPNVTIQGPTLSDRPSPSVTPVSYLERSSPKLEASPIQPRENTIEEANPATVYSPSPVKSQAPQSSPFLMIVDSPSFPMPGGPSTSMPTSSPSFTPTQTSRRPERPPVVLSSKVYETKRPTTSAPNPSSESNKSDIRHHKKVSRFKSERM